MSKNEGSATKARKAKPSVREAVQIEAGRQRGDDHLTPTQRHLIALIASYQVEGGAVAFSKREIALRLGKCERTIDRKLSDLKRRGLIEALPRYMDTGGQTSNAYRVTELTREKYPSLIC